MQELYNRFQQLAEEYSSLKLQCEAGVKVMLNEVAKLLGVFDWSKHFQATSNFVVFSSDLEG